MPYNSLTPTEAKIIEKKGTETPFTGEYDNFYLPGIFICRQCNLPLFSSQAKFDAHCGWPAFDENFPGAITRIPGFLATEVQCSHCRAHLGHVFEGEGFTDKDTRHCINSLSLRFIKEGQPLPKVLND